MHPIQIILLSFSVFAISRVLIRFRRGGLLFAHLALWILFWSAVIVVAFRPETTTVVASRLGVGRGADFAMYVGLLASFYLLFRMFGKIEDLERQITRLVRSHALRDMENEYSKEDGFKRGVIGNEANAKPDAGE